MSASQRSVLIAAGIKKAGRSGQSITLTTEFDEILRDMTERYNILAKSDTGTTTADTAYITMPTDYSDRRFMTVDSYEMIWVDPDDYLKWSKKYRCCRIAGTVYRRQGRFEDLSAKQAVRGMDILFLLLGHPPGINRGHLHTPSRR